MTALTHTIRSTDFHTLVVVAAPDGECTAHLEAGEDGQRVIIARDGALAGEGHWTGQRIENCAAVLAEPDESGRGRDQDASEAVYEALEAGLREMALSTVTSPLWPRSTSRSLTTTGGARRVPLRSRPSRPMQSAAVDHHRRGTRRSRRYHRTVLARNGSQARRRAALRRSCRPSSTCSAVLIDRE